jgi:hypothetical protein
LLLIVPPLLSSLLAGYGPPDQSAVAQNHFRYLILLFDSIAIAAGLVLLKEALSEAGERFYSTLGFAAVLLASPLYMIWASIPLELLAEKLRAPSMSTSNFATLIYVSELWLFFGGALLYVPLRPSSPRCGE